MASSAYTGPVFDMALAQFQDVAEHLEIPEDQRMRLFMPKRTLIVSCPVNLDSGRIAVFQGYRVQHHLTLGPTKGGTRFAPSVDVGDWMPSRMPGMLPAMLAGGAVVAGLAAVADHIYRPAQLTPSKDSALPERTATGALAVLALGLAAGAVAAYASEPEPKRGLARWFG